MAIASRLQRTQTAFVRDLVHFPEHFDAYTSASIALRTSLLMAALIAILGLNALAAGSNQLGTAGLLIVLAEGLKALYLVPFSTPEVR